MPVSAILLLGFLHANAHNLWSYFLNSFLGQRNCWHAPTLHTILIRKNPNCTLQILCQQKAKILAYILMSNLICLKQNFYLKNTFKILHYLSAWYFCCSMWWKVGTVTFVLLYIYGEIFGHHNKGYTIRDTHEGQVFFTINTMLQIMAMLTSKVFAAARKLSPDHRIKSLMLIILSWPDMCFYI